jgi:hypothetical protein
MEKRQDAVISRSREVHGETVKATGTPQQDCKA